jgi:hypothetical protein
MPVYGVLLPVLSARLLLLFFSTAKRKVTKESAAHGPNAPQGHGIAIRWFVVGCKALLSDMVLAFCLCGTMVGLGCEGEAWCCLGATLLAWTAKKGTIRPWAGEWLWGFLLLIKWLCFFIARVEP